MSDCNVCPQVKVALKVSQAVFYSKDFLALKDQKLEIYKQMVVRFSNGIKQVLVSLLVQSQVLSYRCHLCIQLFTFQPLLLLVVSC